MIDGLTTPSFSSFHFSDNSDFAMLSFTSAIALLGLLTSYASATALTYKLTPNEKECFYAHVSSPNAKVAFYFAVQSGGDFDSALPDSLAAGRKAY